MDSAPPGTVSQPLQYVIWIRNWRHIERKNQMTAKIGATNCAMTYAVETQFGPQAARGKAMIVRIINGTIIKLNLWSVIQILGIKSSAHFPLPFISDLNSKTQG
jgi:hypothetical protein